MQDCGGWRLHIVRADMSEPLTAYAARQTDATRWFTLPEMQSLRLHWGFRRWAEDYKPHEQ